MWQINNFVIQEIAAYWEDVAYSSLHYNIPKVDEFKEGHRENPKICCRELFRDWLTTDNRIQPKTWEKSIAQLKEVLELAGNVEKIAKKISSIQKCVLTIIIASFAYNIMHIHACMNG